MACSKASIVARLRSQNAWGQNKRKPCLPLFLQDCYPICFHQHLHRFNLEAFQTPYSKSFYEGFIILVGRGTHSRAWEWLLSNTWKWIMWGDSHADKARGFIGKGHLGGEQWDKGNQENCSAMCVTRGLGFYGDGMSFWVVSGQSFWLRVLPSGAHITQPRWIPGRKSLRGWYTYGLESSLWFCHLSWILPVGGGSLVSCSLSAPPVIK